MSNAEHWDTIYRNNADSELSWFQSDPNPSLQLILETSGGRGRVIDIGGGSSLLVDRLLSHPFERFAVLDVSSAVMERAKKRLGDQSTRVQWITADITSAANLGEFDIWHDRAVFHFLTDPQDRGRYV